MKTMQDVRCLGVAFCLAVAIGMVGFGQERYQSEGIGGPLTGPPVLNAPFSADATTTFRRALGDGTKVEQSTVAHYYRNRAGRVRVELEMNGLEAPKTANERHIRTVVGPTAEDGRTVFALDSVTRTAHYLPRFSVAYASGGGREFALPVGGVAFLSFHRAQDLLARHEAPGGDAVRDESLGGRRIADVETTGRRVTMTIPIGQLRNDKSIEMVDERWESPELKMLVAAHFSDSRAGDVE